jgi:excisionase family DNA binding protein
MVIHGADLMHPLEPIEPVLISVNEACAKLRIGRSTFYHLVKAKRLEIRKISPKCTRVTVESIKRFVAGLPTVVEAYSGAAKPQRKLDVDDVGLGDKPGATLSPPTRGSSVHRRTVPGAADDIR